MVQVVGHNPQAVKRVTHDKCGAVLEYTENEVKIARYTIMGDDSGHKYVDCPNCGGGARIPGTSW